MISAERATAILEERARVLARPPLEEEVGEHIDLITFGLANERYAIDARYVREILRLPPLTPVPGAPDVIHGLVNLRGEILAVADLEKLLGLETSGSTEISRLIVLGLDRAEVGIVADAVYELATLPLKEIAGLGRESLRGVTKDALIVLDAAALLADRRLFVGDADSMTNDEEDRGTSE